MIRDLTIHYVIIYKIMIRGTRSIFIIERTFLALQVRVIRSPQKPKTLRPLYITHKVIEITRKCIETNLYLFTYAFFEQSIPNFNFWTTGLIKKTW